WHNNHHAFPASARHGLQWWQFDLSWITIRSLAAVGLVKRIRLPGAERMAAKRIGRAVA
ncbi:MAG TPA: acyl-CoA desaturase, partial [Phycisphaerales bacterium]|nr:acyl-CoA desaturase [Phycisphaerales bacterium]